MKKTSIELFLKVLFPALLCFTSCTNHSTNENQTESAPTEEKAPEVKVDATIENQTEKEPAPDPLVHYLSQLNSANQLQEVLLNNEAMNGREKYKFKYTDNWFSIEVNDDGITYLGVYEVGQNNTVLHYASVNPEIYMEGSFVNYEMEPEIEYYYQNEHLIRTKYHDPQNQDASNPLEDFDQSKLLNLGDSIKKQIDHYLYLDSSKTAFEGAWKYLKSSDSYDFNLELRQVGSFVWGTYCAHTPSQSDCGVIEQGGDPCYVDGYVSADTLYLEFLSCYAQKLGLAELHINNDTLNWRTKTPVETSLVPDEIKLMLKSTN